MVMVPRTYRNSPKLSFSSDISEKTTIPPWCSSARAYERRKPRKVAPFVKSFYPVRENIWEYMNKKESLEGKCGIKIQSRIPVGSKCRNVKLLLTSLLFAILLIFSYLTSDKISQVDLIARILPKAKFISLLNIQPTSMGEECCHRMRHLAAALKRAEHALSKALRDRKRVLKSQNLDTGNQQMKSRNKVYIAGARAFRGANTVEWETRATVWGVLPVWRPALPPETVLSLRTPVPSDCWPIRGSYGELIIDLPRDLPVDLISLEHIRPDTAYSAPRNFKVYGVLTNGTWMKAADGMYEHDKAAKQYFQLYNRNSPLQQVVFRVMSNQGNPKYTCLYRIHLYSSL